MIANNIVNIRITIHVEVVMKAVYINSRSGI